MKGIKENPKKRIGIGIMDQNQDQHHHGHHHRHGHGHHQHPGLGHHDQKHHPLLTVVPRASALWELPTCAGNIKPAARK